MCLIIHKPAGVQIPLWIIESAAEYNPDGVGIMARDKAQRWLSIGNAKVAARLDALTNVEAAVHFRWATHGNVTTDNVHPFRLNNGGYLMHNGVLSKYAPLTKLNSHVSDSRMFVKKFVNPMIREYGNVHRMQMDAEVVGSAILTMMHGKFARFGSGWVEYDGAWYSNEYAWDCPLAYAYSASTSVATTMAAPYSNSMGQPMNTTPSWSTYSQQGAYFLTPDEHDKMLSTVIIYQDFIDVGQWADGTTDDDTLYAELFEGTLSMTEFLDNITDLTLCLFYEQLESQFSTIKPMAAIC